MARQGISKALQTSEKLAAEGVGSVACRIRAGCKLDLGSDGFRALAGATAQGVQARRCLSAGTAVVDRGAVIDLGSTINDFQWYTGFPKIRSPVLGLRRRSEVAFRGLFWGA